MKTWVLLVGLGLISVGPMTAISPQFAARTYGVELSSADGLGFLRATAIRDVALGVSLIALVGIGSSLRALSAAVLSLGVVAAGDALNVFLHRGSVSAAMGLHLFGLLLLMALGWWLQRKPQDRTTSG